MKRLVYIISAFLILAPMSYSWGGSNLKQQFPRTAHMISEKGEELIAILELQGTDLTINIRKRNCGVGVSGTRRCGPKCDANGVIASEVKQFSTIHKQRFEFTCGRRGDGWALRKLRGTIDQMEIKNVAGHGSAGGGIFVFLPPREFAEYSEARYKNVGESFDTKDWIDKTNSSIGASLSTESSVVDDLAIELEFWQTIKNSNDPDMFQAYLDEYPNGKFSPLARLKIKKLKSD